MKRLLAALLSVLIATGAFAADGVIQVPADSTGKKLDTSNIPAGSESSVHRQRVTVGDPADANKLAHVNASGQLEVSCTGCSAASTVNVAHISSALHIAGGSIAATQGGTWTTTANAGSGSLTVNQGGTWTTTAHKAGAWTIDHISSTVHVAGTVAVSGTVPVSGTVAVSSGTVSANQSGTWTIQAAHQAGQWNVAHVTSVVHALGSMQIISQAGTPVTVTGTALDVNCTGCSSASTVAVSHVSAVTHVAAAGPLPVVQSAQQGAWPVTAHQGGTWTVAGSGNFVVSQGTAGNAVWPVAAHQAGSWNTAVNQSGSLTVQAAHQAGTWNTNHVSSATHVVGTVMANRGSGQMTCHSTAVFATSANAIVIHAAGSNRIFVCGILLTVAHATSVSIVEGTGAACVTNTTAIIGSTDATNGQPFDQKQGFATVSPFPWIATQTAGNNVCVLTSATVRVNGTITYAGVP